MRRPQAATGLSFLVVGAAAIWAATPSAQPARTGNQPVVVELFQSQGCSDCPPAQENLNRLADRPDVLALSYGVTYWDSLGWKDSFASPQFTRRQRDYSDRNDGAGVATPQYWINGRQTVLGANVSRVAQLIGQGGPTGGPAILVNGTVARLGAARAPAGGADILLVQYDPRTIPVAIRAGENGGRTIPHRDIVRQLVRIGRWTGAAQTLALPVGTAGLKRALLVQAGPGGPILSAMKI